MARKLRIQYPGAIYHVMSRGDHRERVFMDEFDRRNFLETLERACDKTGWQVHAYCLMTNHFHLVVETPIPNLCDGMKWLLQTYTHTFNRRHRCVGHLFSGRYKTLLVDGSGNGYLRTVSEYVHLNPVRGRLISGEEALRSFRWSSYPLFLEEKRPGWLRVDRVLGEFGIPADTRAGRERFEQIMEQRRTQADAPAYGELRGGWCLGSEQFQRELLEQVSRRIGPNHFGAERRESAEQRAQQIIAEALTAKRLTRSELLDLPATNPFKLDLARRLRRETLVSLRWVADELRVASWKYLSNLLSLGSVLHVASISSPATKSGDPPGAGAKTSR